MTNYCQTEKLVTSVYLSEGKILFDFTNVSFIESEQKVKIRILLLSAKESQHRNTDIRHKNIYLISVPHTYINLYSGVRSTPERSGRLP